MEKVVTKPRGYIALLSVVLISMTLLILTLQSNTGYQVRSDTQQKIWRAQALESAAACINIAHQKLATTPRYELSLDSAYDTAKGGVPMSRGNIECVITSIVPGTQNGDKLLFTITAQGLSHNAHEELTASTLVALPPP